MMNVYRARIVILVLQLFSLALFSTAASAQSKAEMRKIFARAENHFLYGDYDLAKELYLQLETADNQNIQYKIGACYVNIPDEKEKAVRYLEDAVRNFSYDSKTASFKEKRAPVDAYFFLSKAYLINNDFDKALKTLETFRDLAIKAKDKGGISNPDFIEQQIRACRNAIKYRESPVPFTKSSPGPILRKNTINDNPVISYDGKTIAYTERNGLSSVIMFSKKEGDRWTEPRQFLPVTDPGDDISSCSLNHDGTLMFLYKTDNYDGNIYSSTYENGNWTPVKKLNANINTRFFESHASVSADGKRLYFSSNRDGGFGGLDIYVSEKDASGDWGTAVNLGSVINTRFNEDTPFITLNDSLLYFSSEGHNSMGGYDNYFAGKEGSSWSSPVNLGFPLNTTDDDLFFHPFNNGRNGYYSSPTGFKEKDIFYISFGKAPSFDRVYDMRGTFSLNDRKIPFNDDYSVHLIDLTDGDTVDVGYPNRHSGDYNFITGPGRYRLVYTGKGYLTRTIDTLISANYAGRVVDIDVVLDRDPNYAAQAEQPYERIDLTNIPVVASIDSSILIRDLQVSDVTADDERDTTVLYYTVQVMALYNPVDISYFKHVSDIKVLYNENDRFYRYTTGVFKLKDDAYAHRDDLFRKGYPDDLFIKKVSRISGEKAVFNERLFTIQLKATKTPVNMRTTFRGYEGVVETKEMDGLYHYLYGKYRTFEEAKSDMDKIEGEEFKDAFVREINMLINK